MEIRPKNEVIVKDVMPGLRIPNIAAYTFIGALICEVPALVLFTKSHFALGITIMAAGAIGGGALGVRASRRPSKLKVEGHYIAWNDEELRIKGRCGWRTTEVRFGWSDIHSINMGRIRTGLSQLLVGTQPLVRTIDAVALVIREQDGHEICFNMVGACYSGDDLNAFFAASRAKLQHLSIGGRPTNA